MAELVRNHELAGASGCLVNRRCKDRGPAGQIRDWERLRRQLAAVRGRWDLAVLANLARGVTRPGDLIEAIDAQAPGRRISWKVLTETLRRLEDEGYVGHREVSRLPRVTRYWLTPAGYRLVEVLCLLDAWYQELEASHDSPTEPGNADPSDCAADHRTGGCREAEEQG